MQREIIHQRFLDYYAKLGFQVSYRAPMLHPSVPMSFVMSAGLVQIELGLTQMHLTDGDPPPAILIQTCFRHFDIQKIGARNTHLSLFEMPGAFIFGLENRQQMLRWQWAFVTDELQMPVERIWATYFTGGQLDHHALPADDDSRATWLALGLPPERVIGFGMEANFWQQGGSAAEDPTRKRKCGPQTELFFDRGVELRCGDDCLPGCACGRFVEFCNTLFVAHEYDSLRAELSPLALPFTETVIGTERVAMILQNAPSVFDTLEFAPLMGIIHDCYAGGAGALMPDEALTHMRVIADHMRSVYVLIAEGAPPPGKNGRARIMRQLIRAIITRMRLLDYGRTIDLDPLLEAVRANVAHLAPDAESVEIKFRAYFAQEVVRFLSTVKQGEQELVKLVEANGGATLTGAQMSFLEKKMGLPLLLIRRQLQSMQLDFDEAAYAQSLKDTSAVPSQSVHAPSSVHRKETAMAMDFEEVKRTLAGLLDQAVDAVGADLATFYLYDADRDQLYFPIGVRLTEDHKAEFERSIPDMDRTPGRVVSTKESIFESDVPHGRLAGPFSSQENVQSAAALPLIGADDKVLGTTFFSYRRHREFTPDERQMLGTSAKNLAIAIQNEIKRRSLSLDTEFVAAWMLLQRERDIIGKILERAEGALRDKQLIFMLPDKAYTQLEPYALPMFEATLGNFTLPLDGSNFIVKAFSECIDQSEMDVTALKLPAIAERAQRERWGMGVAIPLLITPRRAVGVLCAFTVDRASFNDSEHEILHSYAEQVAVQINGERRFDSVTALNTLASRLTRVTSFDEAVRAIMADIMRILDADVVSLDVYDPAKGAFTHAYTRDSESGMLDFESYRSARKPTPIEASILERGAVITINDVSKAEREFVDEFVGLRRIQSYTAVALKYKDVKMGVLYVNSRFVNAFSSDEIRQVKNLVTFASNALYAVWFNQKRDQFRQVMEALAKQNQDTDLDTLIKAVLTGCVALFDCEVASFGVYKPATHRLYFQHFIDDHGAFSQSVEEGMAGKAFRTQQPVVTGNVKNYAGYTPHNAQTKSEMDIPLIIENRVIGVLNLESQRPNAFNEDMQRLAVALAAQVAPLIHSRQLRKREQVLEQFGRDIRLGVNLKPEDIYKRVVAIANELELNTQDFYMALHDDLVGELKYVIAFEGGKPIPLEDIQDPKRRELNPRLAEWQPRRDGQRRADWVAKHVKPLCHFTRADGEAWYNEHRPQFTRQSKAIAPSWIGVPIDSGRAENADITETQVRGVIVLQDEKSEHAFNDSDEQVLRLLANLVGIALYNSTLYNDVAQRYRTLASVLEQVTEQVDVNESMLFGLFHDAAANHIKALQSMYVALYDRITDEIRFPYMKERGEDKAVEPRKFKSRDPKSWGRTELILHDWMNDHRNDRLIHNTQAEAEAWYKEHQNFLTTTFSSYLGVPIVLGERIFGVLAVYDDDREYLYGESEYHILSALARILAIVLDAREQRERQRADSAFKALGLQSGIILHRLRNLIAPINIDIMRLQPRIAKLGDPPLNPEIEGLLKKIDSAAEDSVRIISKLSEQLHPMESEPQDLASRIGDIVETVNTKYPHVNFHNDVTEDLPLVSAPTYFVSEMFTNLFENACRYLPEGGDVYVRVVEDSSPGFVTISVSDTGPDVPEHLQNRLFVKAMPSDPKIATRQTLGLGLYLTYLQIKTLGGNLRYVSKEHRHAGDPKGAKFVVEFPKNANVG